MTLNLIIEKDVQKTLSDKELIKEAYEFLAAETMKEQLWELKSLKARTTISYDSSFQRIFQKATYSIITFWMKIVDISIVFSSV